MKRLKSVSIHRDSLFLRVLVSYPPVNTVEKRLIKSRIGNEETDVNPM